MRAGWAALALALAVVAAAGCGGSGSVVQAEAPSTSRAPVSRADAFLTDVRTAGFGTMDLSNDVETLALGRQACRLLVDLKQPTPGGVSEGYRALLETFRFRGNATAAQADTLVSSAVRNLCPENSRALPQ